MRNGVRTHHARHEFIARRDAWGPVPGFMADPAGRRDQLHHEESSPQKDHSRVSAGTDGLFRSESTPPGPITRVKTFNHRPAPPITNSSM